MYPLAANLRLFIRDLIRATIPLGQFEATPDEAIATNDLGLGFVYYTLARITKPEAVVVIGSYRGFSVVCFALGLLHNGRGRVHFIDASKVDDFWTNEEQARNHFGRFGVQDFVSFYNVTTEQCLRGVAPFNGNHPFIDVLLIDGDHRRDAVAHDFTAFGALVREGGLVCLHDSLAGGVGKTPFQVAEYLSSLQIELYESLTLECAKGLTIIKKLGRDFVSFHSLHHREELKGWVDGMIARAGEESSDTEELTRLRQLVVQVFEDLAQQERLLEVRHQYLTKSAEAMHDQIVHLKAEVKRLRSQLARTSADSMKPAGPTGL